MIFKNLLSSSSEFSLDVNTCNTNPQLKKGLASCSSQTGAQTRGLVKEDQRRGSGPDAVKCLYLPCLSLGLLPQERMMTVKLLAKGNRLNRCHGLRLS